jgi:hypothetical protein
MLGWSLLVSGAGAGIRHCRRVAVPVVSVLGCLLVPVVVVMVVVVVVVVLPVMLVPVRHWYSLLLLSAASTRDPPWSSGSQGWGRVLGCSSPWCSFRRRRLVIPRCGWAWGMLFRGPS